MTAHDARRRDFEHEATHDCWAPTRFDQTQNRCWNFGAWKFSPYAQRRPKRRSISASFSST
jgi:hypothetical protein